MTTKDEIIARLTHGLDRAAEVRASMEADADQAARRQILRA